MAERVNQDVAQAIAENGKDSPRGLWNSLRSKKSAISAAAMAGALSLSSLACSGEESGRDPEGATDTTITPTTEVVPEEAPQEEGPMEQEDREEWFATWEAEDNRQQSYHPITNHRGEQHEILFDETRENIEGFVDDFVSRLELISSRESEEDLDRGLLGNEADTHTLRGVSLLLQNEDGIFQVKNPIIRGIIFPSDSARRSIDSGEDIESVFTIVDADTQGAGRSMLFYPDQNGDWQILSWYARNFSVLSDESTDIIGVFMEDGYEEPEVVRGAFDWEGLQPGVDNIDEIVINDDTENGQVTVHEPGQEATVDRGEVNQTTVALSPQTFDSMDEAWEYHQEAGIYRPVTIDDLLLKTDNSVRASMQQ